MEQQNSTFEKEQTVSPSGTSGMEKIFIAGGIAVIILATLAVSYYFFDVGKSPEKITEERKSNLIERINEADVRPLTEGEKIEILEKYGGDKTAQYNFTDEQKEKILKALNGN